MPTVCFLTKIKKITHYTEKSRDAFDSKYRLLLKISVYALFVLPRKYLHLSALARTDRRLLADNRRM